MSPVPCALCGSSENHLIVGRTGCACVQCLGEAAKQLIAQERVSHPPTLTASDHCLLCGEGVASGNAAASRGPYALCGQCVVDVLASSKRKDETFLQVGF